VKKILLLISSIALVAAACGSSDDTAAELPANTSDDVTPAASGACLEGEPDCDDTPGGEPTDLPPAGDDEEPLPTTIRVAAAADADGPVAVAGFIVATGDDLRLCEALAESFPPQCGGSSIPISGLDQVDPNDLQSEGDVTWTDYAVTLFGEMVDGLLVVTPVE
jgi:hypothetical protein